MKIQLLLEDNELELGQNISIPLNKTFENLNNPTDIVTEYSKSINVPLTSKNNQILSNSYRLDRTIVANNPETNLGIYLDPTKKIPMKLLYNSSVVLEGYAKFVSANNSTKNSYYTLNLFGTLGDIFQKLKSVVVSESQLTAEQKAEPDGGKKYVLVDRSIDGSKLNYDYVYYSFINTFNSVYGPVAAYDVIGFAPSYRGYYNEFDSKTMQIRTGTSLTEEDRFQSIESILTDNWKAKYKASNSGATDDQAQSYAESLGAGDVVGEGLKDYQVREYRSYMLKPYIYFNQLLQMYQDQIKLISDYKLELDTNWFNVNNPYWTRLCYMLDYLDSKDGNEDISVQFTERKKLTNGSVVEGSTSGTLTMSHSSTIINDYIASSKTVNINPFTIHMEVAAKGPNTAYFGYEAFIDVPYSTYFKITVGVGNKSQTKYKYFFVSFYDYNDIKNNIYDSQFTEENYIRISKPKTKWRTIDYDRFLETGDFHDLDLQYYFNFDIPIDAMIFDFATDTSSIYLSTSVKIVNQKQKSLFTTKCFINSTNIPSMDVTPTAAKPSSAVIDALYINQSWRDNIDISLANIFFKEDTNLFDIILQYTKMFGLIWDIDYNTKTVKLLHKSTYFNELTITDWSDKLDRNKDFIIEPITFNSRSIKFNYEDVDGYRYSGYRDKYGVNIGDKILHTGYDFGNETKDLFKDITPSSASSKSYVTFMDWYNWDLTSQITPTTDPYPIIDAEDEEQKSALSIYNWYLRGTNKAIPNSLTTQFYLTDDSVDMKQTGKYCWYTPALAKKNGVYLTTLPVFNVAINEPTLFPQLAGRSLSCIFNTPNEDFTSNKSISASNGNAIYDLFWKKFVNERYNIQNKKVTAYFYIDANTFLDFSFNKLITVDNQLFMVNKIFDYDMNGNGLTKVELIQVTDMDVYKNGSESFPPIVISPTEVDVIGSLHQGISGGSMALLAHITYFDANGEIERGYWGSLVGTLILPTGQTLTSSDQFWDYIQLEHGDWESNIGSDSMYLYWENMTGAVFRGTLDYTLPDGTTYQIPITIDYTK